MEMEDESRSAPAAHAADAADAAGDAAACYVERLVDIGADSPLFAAFYDADAGVWAWRLAWVDSAGRMCVVEEDIPDELLRDDGDDDAAPDLHAAIVLVGIRLAEPFCRTSSCISPRRVKRMTGRFLLHRPIARRPTLAGRSAASGISTGVTSRGTPGRTRQAGQPVCAQVARRIEVPINLHEFHG
jgi:hypothetical protein